MSKVEVIIREETTGREATYTGPFLPEIEAGMSAEAMSDALYSWEEGNWSCDCNRDDGFHQALGEDPLEHQPCGSERFKVRILLDGNPVYEEYEAAAATQEGSEER